MKKILLSIGTLVAVGAIVAGATIAFYNDTETSAGNIFVAGSIDLKVDHLSQTYNGVDCETCSVDVYSSNATDIVAASVGASNQGPFPMPAVEVASPHPNWLPESTLAPAQWIWATDPTTVDDTTNGATYTFENKFQWNGTVSAVDLDFAFASDNGYKIVLNGVTVVDNLLSEFNYNGSTISLTAPEEAIFIASMIANGENTLQIVVRNKPLAGNPVTQNPAGLLFNLNIQRDLEECEADSAFQNACILWQAQDLDGSQTFFSFGDVKPADLGTNLISLHVDSNDAYACLLIHNMDDQENSLVEPETTVGDAPGVGNPLGYGELSDYIDIFAWEDDGNGVYEPLTENSLYEGNIQAEQIELTLSGGGPTGYVGFAWCAGDILVDHITGLISCDGNGMLDDAQSDSLGASLTAYAEQVRNNTGFSCDGLDAQFPNWAQP